MDEEMITQFIQAKDLDYYERMVVRDTETINKIIKVGKNWRWPHDWRNNKYDNIKIP